MIIFRTVKDEKSLMNLYLNYKKMRFTFFDVDGKKMHLSYYRNLIDIKVSINGNPVVFYQRVEIKIYGYKNILAALKRELEQLKCRGFYLPEEELEGIKGFLIYLKSYADKAKEQYNNKQKIFDTAIEAVSKYLEEAE